jgi:methyl-accepting chemotaxis protein
MEVADAIAMGDLSKKIDASAKDETGALLASMSKMQEVLKGFVSAQGEMKHQHDAGTISYRMDDKSFSGSYAEMAQKTNELVASHIAVQTRVMEVVSQYARGDLSVDMDKLPGEKAKITTAIDGVKTNLQAVNAQIQVLVDAAGRGDFTVRGDEAKFEYEFRKMVAGLNSLMQTSDTGLNEVARVLGALAKGDLTEKVSNDYQGTFGKLMDDSNKTVENLTTIVNQIKEASETINTASGEITQGNTDLSQRTEEQASSLEETASSMEELTSTVKQNAENAKQANQLAVSASDVAVKGGDVVKQVVTTMTGISESSKKIADIIGTIDGIAFQTNILALNAAVEAARAGEQGRGFAVVATEVRNLAQRSAAAAKEIKALIEDSVGRVDVGSKLVDEAGQTMEEIVNSVKRVTDIMAEITAASQEQSTGIEQVNQAITQMDEVTQQNAALVEEAAAAAESMQEQAGNLVQSVSQFKMVQGAGAARVAERRGTQRAVNVARLPGKPTAKAAQPARKPAANTPALKKAVGAEDDWQEF